MDSTFDPEEAKRRIAELKDELLDAEEKASKKEDQKKLSERLCFYCAETGSDTILFDYKGAAAHMKCHEIIKEST